MKPLPTAPSRHFVAAGLATAVLLGACDRASRPPADRPLEGARPVAAAGSSIQGGPPPTLAPAAALVITPTAAPTSTPVPTGPSPSPSIYPIVSNLQPAPGATLPVGDVVIGARITTLTDLSDLVLIVNDEPLPQDVSRPDERVKSVRVVRSLAAGTYDVRIQARDQQGQQGGYRWQFTVSGARPAGAAPRRRPTIAVPTVGPPATSGTRRAPLPSPTPRPAGR